jgi:hypothetical protein
MEESRPLDRLVSDLPNRKEGTTVDEEIRDEQLDDEVDAHARVKFGAGEDEGDDDVQAHLRDKWGHEEGDDDEDRGVIKK